MTDAGLTITYNPPWPESVTGNTNIGLVVIVEPDVPDDFNSAIAELRAGKLLPMFPLWFWLRTPDWFDQLVLKIQRLFKP